MRVNNWPFIGADGVGPVFESHANVIGGRLTSLGIQRAGLEHHVGLGGVHPTGDMADRPGSIEITRKQLLWREAFTINEPSEAARRYSGDVPPDTIAVGKFLPLALQKPHKS